jgi:hypothetical protein
MNMFVRSFFYIFCLTFLNAAAFSAILEDDPSLKVAKNVLNQIKDDPKYHSFQDMLDDVKGEHSIKYHKPNAPFFYSNDHIVMEDIIKLVLEDPDGIVDQTKTKGTFIVYREFNYHDEIEELFDREPLYRRIIPEPKKFQNNYLGLTVTGPTNKVGILLKVKGDEQNAATFEQRTVYTGNNIDFVDAYPMNAKDTKRPSPPTSPSSSAPSSPPPAPYNETPKAAEGVSPEAKPSEKAPTDASVPTAPADVSNPTASPEAALQEAPAPAEVEPPKT